MKTKIKNDSNVPIKKSKFKIILSVIICIIILITIVNQITVYPFMYVFRAFINSVPEQVRIGPYSDRIINVNESETIEIPVKDYSNAKITIYSPSQEYESLPLILYIHGGGWSVGNAKAVSSYAKLLASNGYIVANLDYSLAPEYPYPTSTMQIIDTLNYLYENAATYKIDNTKIFIGGNSAGAHLSSQVGAIISNQDFAKEVGANIVFSSENIRGLLLYNGVYNFDTVGDCNFPGLNKLAWSYTGKKNYLKYERIDQLSSIKHITKNYPATFITVGDADPLEPQTYEFVEELKNKNIDCTSLFWTDTNSNLNHDYIYELQTKEGQKAYEMTVKFLNEHSK